MISKLKIKNYQSHIDSNIEFDMGLNVITGSSDSGKTSILRALNWVINNRPIGDSFINHNSDSCEVEIQIDNNIIKRIKNKKENLYYINDKKLTAFGTEVPDEIKKVLNFCDLNIQKQLESPFLLSQSAGEVAKYFNKIINLDIIATSLKNIESMKRNFKNEYERKEKEEKEIEKEIKKFNWIDNFENKLNKLNKLNNLIQNNEEKINFLVKNIKLYEETEEKLSKTKKILKKEKKLFILFEKYNIIEINNKKIMDLKENFILYEKYKNKIKKITNNIIILQNKFDENIGNICPLCNQVINPIFVK